MTLFFDTSALVKLFHWEEGSAATVELARLAGPNVVVSELARLEFVTTMHRKVRNREVTESTFADAISGFEEAWATFRVEPLGRPAVREGEALVRAHGRVLGLRTLDALHLASFSLVADPSWSFVAADDGLARVARAMGYSVHNPLERTA